jgi:hypothetical protein
MSDFVTGRLLVLVLLGLAMSPIVEAGDPASPSQFGRGPGQYNYYGPAGSGNRYPYGGAPGYAPPGYTTPASPATATDAPAVEACDDAAEEIARLKQRIQELEAANEQLARQQQQPAAPAVPAVGARSGYSTSPASGGQPGSPAAGPGQGYPSGDTRYIPAQRDPSKYVPPPQDIGPRVYEFNN